MGVMGFLILFLILILFIFPLITKRNRVSRGTAVEVKGLDGTVLVFSDEGISIFRHGEFRFFKREEIKELTIKKEGNSYRIVLKAGNETFEVLVPETEIRKLFSAEGKRVNFTVPWLPLILGTTLPFLLFETVEHLEDHNRNDTSEHHQEDNDHRDFDLGVPVNDYDYFDTGDWPDDDIEV